MSLHHPHLFLAAARHLQLLYVSAESCTFTAMASDSVHVALMSGRGAQVPASIDRPLKYVKLQAQNALQTGLGVLRDSTGRVLDEQKAVGEAGLRLGDSLTLQVRPARLASNGHSFAVTMGDGSVVTWGHQSPLHVRQELLRNAQHIQVTVYAFAAILGNGSVVNWGNPNAGGDSSNVQDQLRNVQHIQATRAAFAAILDNGSVVTWGNPNFGGDSSNAQEQLRNVQHIQATEQAFAAILDNGSVVTWGVASCGGDSSNVQEQLRNVHLGCCKLWR